MQEDHHGNDRNRGDRAAEAEPLQPLDQRIEQIGEHHAGDERQQHVAQQPQQRNEDQQRAGPENRAAAAARPGLAEAAAARRPLPVLVMLMMRSVSAKWLSSGPGALPPYRAAPLVPKWRIHSAT